MKRLWFELDYHQNLKMKNSEDIAMFHKFIEKELIFEFLRFNIEYDQVNIQLLGKE